MPLDAQIDFSRGANWDYAKGLGRVLAGAAMFSLPILMTMEMWWLGFYLERVHLVQFAVVNFVVLVGLSRVSGFEDTATWGDDVMDAFAAYAVAAIWSATILLFLGIISLDQPAGEAIGKIAVESVPASFGAMLASKQLGRSNNNDSKVQRERSSYWGQLFLMMGGALFLGFSVAPTEEMILISFRMNPALSIALVLLSVALLHGIVYTVGFRGQEKPQGPVEFWSVFARFTVVGYAISALVALYLLWTFGRIDGTNGPHVAAMVVVLAFPGAIGAALARLVI